MRTSPADRRARILTLPNLGLPAFKLDPALQVKTAAKRLIKRPGLDDIETVRHLLQSITPGRRKIADTTLL